MESEKLARWLQHLADKHAKGFPKGYAKLMLLVEKARRAK
jgi:hypothetical protein